MSLGLLFFGAMVFFPAGTLRFWQGWLYLMSWCIPGFFATAYFYKHDPQLVERRVQMKERVPAQKLIMGALYVFYLAGVVAAGLDHRFGWSDVPLWLTLVSWVTLMTGYGLVLWVMRVNSFASRTIRVEAGQTVIADGPYRFVRHPMYLGMSVMMLSTPLVLGSLYALPVFVLVIPLLIFRLLNEEKVLLQQLAGYADYCLRTRFHLVPYLW